MAVFCDICGCMVLIKGPMPGNTAVDAVSVAVMGPCTGELGADWVQTGGSVSWKQKPSQAQCPLLLKCCQEDSRVYGARQEGHVNTVPITVDAQRTHRQV